nr:NIL domain-containing protein [Lachnospiraceae bacterium]
FDGLEASKPFISDLVEKTGKKVNILSANTKSVGGIGYGQMVIELPNNPGDQKTIIDFFTNNGLNVQEVERIE